MASSSELPASSGLHRELGLFDLTCLGLNAVIGSGVFLSPGLIAAKLGGAGAAAFVAGGLLCFAIALCFAEMAGMVPVNGAACVYAREAFGPFVGFLVGWVMWLSGLLGWAAVAVGFGGLVEQHVAAAAKAWGHPLHGSGNLSTAVVCAIVVGLAVANLRGVRQGAASNNALAMLKLAPLGVFALWALPAVDSRSLPGFGPAATDWMGGFLLVLYTFSGFEEVPVPAGETRDAQRTVPRALALVLLVSTVLYVVVQAAVTSLGVAGTETPLEDAVRGHGLLAAIVTAGAIASFASVNASVAFTAPRSLWVLAADGWMPLWLARLDPATGVPTRAVVVTSSVTLGLCLTGTFETLAVLSVLASLLQYLPTIVGVLVLRRTRPEAPRPVLIPGGAAIPATALVVCLFLLVTSERSYLLGALGALALGVIAGMPRLLKRPTD
ncbi:MAG: amino acid permease [Candidatus Wallbacteria bacterium]|nr:amino acid permease [Candidatus Wallbacteria bacterium]